MNPGRFEKVMTQSNRSENQNKGQQQTVDPDHLVENAEHTLFVCARWGAGRQVVGPAVGAQLTTDTIVSLMLQSEQIWMLIESFVTLVIKTRELDGRAERGNNES